MECAWTDLLKILPIWLREKMVNYENDNLQELRMRINSPPELVFQSRIVWLEQIVTQEDLSFCVHAATQYSPWTASGIRSGYITAHGGHRIGICGESIIKEGVFCGIRQITSLCIRVARDYHDISRHISAKEQSILIIGAPGWGKTTLLRDLSRKLAQDETVSVVDERGELFPAGFQTGRRMDILSGCPKVQGIETVLRTMGPEIIAVDEITAEEDCNALIKAAGCGVALLATAHASSIQDFMRRPVYAPLIGRCVFDQIIVMNRDKTYHTEVIECTSGGLARS